MEERIIVKKDNIVTCKQIRVIVGDKVVSYNVTYEIIYSPLRDNEAINHLIKSIHIAQVKCPDNTEETICFYKNCFNYNIAILNPDISNLLINNENISFSSNGVIIFWDEHAICTTIDLEQLDFHLELDQFLEMNHIVFLSSRYVSYKSPSGDYEAKKLQADIDLSDYNHPVKISFHKK